MIVIQKYSIKSLLFLFSWCTLFSVIILQHFFYDCQFKLKSFSVGWLMEMSQHFHSISDFRWMRINAAGSLYLRKTTVIWSEKNWRWKGLLTISNYWDLHKSPLYVLFLGLWFLTHPNEFLHQCKYEAYYMITVR